MKNVPFTAEPEEPKRYKKKEKRNLKCQTTKKTYQRKKKMQNRKSLKTNKREI
jgi:hypothetical protein